jgi:hypothetical protein
MDVKEESRSITFCGRLCPAPRTVAMASTWPSLPGFPRRLSGGLTRLLREIERETVIDPRAGSKKGKSSKYTQLIFFNQPGVEPV